MDTKFEDIDPADEQTAENAVMDARLVAGNDTPSSIDPRAAEAREHAIAQRKLDIRTSRQGKNSHGHYPANVIAARKRLGISLDDAGDRLAMRRTSDPAHLRPTDPA